MSARVGHLWRDRRFTLAAVLTLALGIGLSTAVFTVAEALLLRDLPVRDQDRVVALWGETADRSFTSYPLTHAQAREFTSRAQTLQRSASFAYQGAWPTPIRQGDAISRLRQALVSGEYFDVLGVQPMIGRGLRPDDDRVGARPVAVLSHGAWRRAFGASHAAVGQHIVVNGSGIAYEIIGVTPEGLDLPAGTDFWVPLVPATTRPGTDVSDAYVHLIGRLAADATPAAARDELTAYLVRPDAPAPARGLRGVVMPLRDLLLGDAKPAVIAFAVGAVLLLLLTCINVANLLLVRGLARSREFAMRVALGARRRQLVAQLVTENAVLAIGGGTLGLGVAAIALKTFAALAPASVPRLTEIRLDLTTLAGASITTAVALLVFGVVPALVASHVSIGDVLRGAGITISRERRWISEGLVVGQIALAVLVLSAAGLLTRSLVNLEQADLALEPANVLIAELALPDNQIDQPAKQLALLDRLLETVRAVPGIAAVSPVVATPFAGNGGWDGHAAAEWQSTEDAARNPMFNIEVVVPEYFATLGIPVRHGRLFTGGDVSGAPPVVVVSEAAARSLWPNQGSIGQRLQVGSTADNSLTVIGVVRDTRYRDLRTPRPTIYFPLRQSTFPAAPLTLAIRTDGAPAAVTPSLRHAIASMRSGVRLASAAPFQAYLDPSLEQPRLNAALMSVFAAAALALAAIGQFGVMATMVRQRTRELGVRLALGATSSDIRRLVMGRGLALALVGSALGFGLARGANWLLTAMLFGVGPTDGATLLIVGGLLVAVGAAATGIPARSATRIDPILTLRDVP